MKTRSLSNFQVRETAMETGCEMNPAKRRMNMNIRAIRIIRGKILDMSDGRYLSSNFFSFFF